MNVMIKSTYDWLLHFNPYTQMWNLFHKEDTVAYWNGDAFKHPHIKSHNLDTLKSILEETSGLEDKIIEYINKHV